MVFVAKLVLFVRGMIFVAEIRNRMQIWWGWLCLASKGEFVRSETDGQDSGRVE